MENSEKKENTEKRNLKKTEKSAANSKQTIEEKEDIYWLCKISFLGSVRIKKMIQQTGSVCEICRMQGKDWVKAGIFSEKQGKEFDEEKKNISKSAEEYHSLEKRGIQFITILDENYPERLRLLHDGPVGFYLKGSLPVQEKPSLAIVGSRNATQYGLEVARCFGRELAANGVQIISGLASGIDQAGHRGAMEGQGKTMGILGCGINICYPKENYPLYEAMAKNGGILSEYPLGEPPLARNFPIRNRIISGLSDGVAVIEARERSGSLITAGLALDQGKEVFAVPGRITDPGSFGCNRLIQTGASLVLSPADILEFFGIKYGKKLSLHEKNEKGLAKREKMLYSVLDLQPKHLEDIARESGLSLSESMMILLDLEIKGFAAGSGGNYYSKCL